MRKLKTDFIRYVSFNILAMISVSIYILADTYFISKALGATGLAALNFAIVVFSLIHGVSLMTGVGGAIDFAISDTGKMDSGDESFVNALVIGAVCSVFLMVIGLFFNHELAVFLGADVETIGPTKIYLKTILVFSPFFILNQIVLAFVRNDKNPRLSMMAMALSSFSNIVLDYVFIFSLNMGIFGAAFATSISPIISLVLLSIHFKSRNNRFHLVKCKIKMTKILRMIKYGIPSFVTELSSAITLFAFNWVILGIVGNIGVAAYGIIANVAIVVVALFTGLAQGIQPLVSRYYSKSNDRGLRSTLKYSLVTSSAIFVFVILTVFLFSTEVVEVFNNEGSRKLSEIAIPGLKLYFSGFLFAGFNIVLTSYYSAISKTSFAWMISILRSGVILVPMVLLLSARFELVGVWVAFGATEFLVTVLILLRNILIERKQIE